MPAEISARLARIVEALPLRPDMRVLEIGCGPGVAARSVAARLSTGHVLAIDRSPKAIQLLTSGSQAELASGRLGARIAAIEDFALADGEQPFDLVFAIRVGALDGRHSTTGIQALERIVAVTTPTGRLFIDGGDPLREVPLPR